MTRKEELVEQLRELLKRVDRLQKEKAEAVNNHSLLEVMNELEALHRKHQAIWKEIAQINQNEQDARGRYI